MQSLVRIAYLADHPHLVPTLTAWLHAEFKYLAPAQLMISRGRRLAESAQKNGLPITFVALSGGVLVGSASLLPFSVSHRELSPLLADVFVTPGRRRCGIGAALVNHIVQHAASQGLETIYLFTPESERFYARLGWKTFGHWTDRGHQYVMMHIDTRNAGRDIPAPT
ncbi:MAG TPA: GNAT family N-acetyltransferase [Burkholderiaceae bacterium]